MTSDLALLRDINVSGKNSIRLPALRDRVSRLGLRDAQTYQQSGNIVFRSTPSDEATLAASIKTGIAQDFGHEVPVLVPSAKDLERIANSNPLQPKAGGEETLFHCAFLSQPVSLDVFQALKLPAADEERAVLMGSAILPHCPNGYGALIKQAAKQAVRLPFASVVHPCGTRPTPLMIAAMQQKSPSPLDSPYNSLHVALQHKQRDAAFTEQAPDSPHQSRKPT